MIRRAFILAFVPLLCFGELTPADIGSIVSDVGTCSSQLSMLSSLASSIQSDLSMIQTQIPNYSTELQSIVTSCSALQSSADQISSALTAHYASLLDSLAGIDSKLSDFELHLSVIDSIYTYLQMMATDLQNIYLDCHSYLPQILTALTGIDTKVGYCFNTLGDISSSFTLLNTNFGEYKSFALAHFGVVATGLDSILTRLQNLNVGVSGSVSVDLSADQMDVFSRNLMSISADIDDIHATQLESKSIQENIYSALTSWSQNLQNVRDWYYQEYTFRMPSESLTYPLEYYNWDSTSFAPGEGLYPQQTNGTVNLKRKVENVRAQNWWDTQTQLQIFRTTQLNQMHVTLAKLLEAVLTKDYQSSTNSTVETTNVVVDTSTPDISNVPELDTESLSGVNLLSSSVVASPSFFQQINAPSFPDSVSIRVPDISIGSVHHGYQDLVCSTSGIRSICENCRVFFALVWWGLLLVLVLRLMIVFVKFVTFLFKSLPNLHIH